MPDIIDNANQQAGDAGGGEDLELDNLLNGTGGDVQTPEHIQVPKDSLNRALSQRKAALGKVAEHEKNWNDPTLVEKRLAELRKPADAVAPQQSHQSQGPSVREVHKIVQTFKDFDDSEIDFIETFAAGRGKKPEEVVNEPAVKTFITAHRQERRTATATPEPSARSPKIQGKTWAEMTPDERKTNFAAHREQHQRGGQSTE